MVSPNHTTHKDTDNSEGVDVSMSFRRLPEELVETILAMVPFPHTFKARALSKSWLVRLSSSSYQDEKELKSLAFGFQNSMAESLLKWKAFGPVFAGDEGFFAYDQESQAWLSIPTSSFVPQNFLMKDFRSYGLHVTGALLLFVNPSKMTSDDYLEPGSLCVTNVLNGVWKQLPARPPAPPELLGHYLDLCGPPTLVSHNETYKVIEFYTDKYSANQSFALIYDSKLSAWSWKTVQVTMHGGEGVHLNGVVYWLVGPSIRFSRNRDLLTYKVEKETFEVLKMFPLTNIPAAPYGRDHLLVCNGSLFTVVINIYNWSIYEQVLVVKIDPVSQTMVTATEAGGATLNLGRHRLNEPPASRGDFIFFLGASCDKVMVYDTTKDDWHSFSIPTNVSRSYLRKGCRWTSSSFQPGLNPFLEL